MLVRWRRRKRLFGSVGFGAVHNEEARKRTATTYTVGGDVVLTLLISDVRLDLSDVVVDVIIVSSMWIKEVEVQIHLEVLEVLDVDVSALDVVVVQLESAGPWCRL